MLCYKSNMQDQGCCKFLLYKRDSRKNPHKLLLCVYMRARRGVEGLLAPPTLLILVGWRDKEMAASSLFYRVMVHACTPFRNPNKEHL